MIDNDTTAVIKLLYKTGISADKLTDRDIEDIHEQLLVLKHLKEERARKTKKRQEILDVLKDIFSTIFKLIYLLMVVLNIAIIPILLKKPQSSDLTIVIIEITIVSILTYYSYIKTQDNKYISEQLTNAHLSSKDKIEALYGKITALENIVSK